MSPGSYGQSTVKKYEISLVSLPPRLYDPAYIYLFAYEKRLLDLVLREFLFSFFLGPRGRLRARGGGAR